MPKYYVRKREVWVQYVKIEAPTPRQAKQMVHDGEGEQIDKLFEFSHLLDPELWDVEDEKENLVAEHTLIPEKPANWIETKLDE